MNELIFFNNNNNNTNNYKKKRGKRREKPVWTKGTFQCSMIYFRNRDNI